MDFAEQLLPRIVSKNSRIIGIKAPESRSIPVLALAICDLLTALCVALLLRAFTNPALLMPWLLASYIGFCLGLVSFGLYPGRGFFGPDRIRRRALATVIAFTPPAIAFGLWSGLWTQALVQVPAFALTLFLLSAFLEIAIISILVRARLWQVDVAIVGDPVATRRVVQDLTLFPELGLRPVLQRAPMTDAETVKLQDRGEDAPQGIEYVADATAPLPAMHAIDRPPSDFATGRNSLHFFVKRLIDIAGALVLLVLSSPILIATALMILLHDGRPLFFKQKRGGKGGRDILVWKFRSMYKDAPARLESVLASDPVLREEWSRFFKLHSDPRILPVIGNFIRRTSIDELPQIWNVLKGDMSLIGPRPFPRDHLEAFGPEFRALRCQVKPGISGLWQVTLRSDGDLVLQEKLDTAYVRGWSIWLDLYILIRTPLVLVSGRGAC